MSLPNPYSMLVLNARDGEVTLIVQDNDPAGPAFYVDPQNPNNPANTQVVITDVGGNAGNYTFAAQPLRVLNGGAQMLVQVQCTGKPAGRITWTTTAIQVTTTTGANAPIASAAVPVLLRTSHIPILNSSALPASVSIQLTLNQPSVFYLPVTGFGHSIGASLLNNGVAVVGTWTVAARQLYNTQQVQVTLTPTVLPNPLPATSSAPAAVRFAVGIPTSSTLTITLISEQGTRLTLPPIPINYLPDPE